MLAFDKSQCLEQVMGLIRKRSTIKTYRSGTATKTFSEFICATISVLLVKIIESEDIFYCFLFKYQNQQYNKEIQCIYSDTKVIITVMNKQLERDLLCTIQSLKASQLANVLSYYESLSNSHVLKNVQKKGVSYECQIAVKGESAKGYGRSQQQSISNSIKGLLSILIGKNLDIDEITKSLKYKNSVSKHQDKNREGDNIKQNSLMLDDISMIQPRAQYLADCYGQKNRDKCVCDCIYFDMHQYHQNQVKHLQARVNLLSEENYLLKKMLLCNSTQKDTNEKQNISYHSNSMNLSDCKIKN